jgi:hypothetical protein
LETTGPTCSKCITFFFFNGLLHLVVDCQTPHCVWRTIEQALASLSNSRIIQLLGSFQDLQQSGDLVTIFMQKNKGII